MKTILIDYKSIKANTNNLTLCLGYFDGVHLGHQKLIKEARKNTKGNLGLLTFDEPISSFIDNGKSKEVITSLDDRFKIISKLGVDFYYVMHIDKDFLNLSKDDFIDLLKKLNVTSIYVGEDYLFGKNKEGKIENLKEQFDTHVVTLLNEKGEKISTQKILSLLKDGNIKSANELLGHNYLISGYVSKGKGIGKTIGYPTMNLSAKTNYVLPKFGVYKTIAYINNIPHSSITNVGIRPTFAGENPTIEVYLPNFDRNIYGESLSIEFIDFIREEKKFSSPLELQKQIELDVEKIR